MKSYKKTNRKINARYKKTQKTKKNILMKGGAFGNSINNNNSNLSKNDILLEEDELQIINNADCNICFDLLVKRIPSSKKPNNIMSIMKLKCGHIYHGLCNKLIWSSSTSHIDYMHSGQPFMKPGNHLSCIICGIGQGENTKVIVGKINPYYILNVIRTKEDKTGKIEILKGIWILNKLVLKDKKLINKLPSGLSPFNNSPTKQYNPNKNGEKNNTDMHKLYLKDVDTKLYDFDKTDLEEFKLVNKLPDGSKPSQFLKQTVFSLKSLLAKEVMNTRTRTGHPGTKTGK